MSRPRLLRTDTVSAALREDSRERVDPLVRRALERDARRFVQRNQVHFAADITEQPHEAPRVFRRVVDAAEEHVLERDAVSALRRKLAGGGEDFLETVLAIDGHERIALVFRRRMQGDGEVRHQRLGRQPIERRQHADRRQASRASATRRGRARRSASAGPSSCCRSCAAARPCPSARC